MKDIFEIDKRPYSSRHDFLLKMHNVCSVWYETETPYFLPPKLWDAIRNDCNNATPLSVLRRKLKVRLQKTVNLEYAKLTFKTFFIKSQISSEAFISLTSVYLISV